MININDKNSSVEIKAGDLVWDKREEEYGIVFEYPESSSPLYNIFIFDKYNNCTRLSYIKPVLISRIENDCAFVSRAGNFDINITK